MDPTGLLDRVFWAVVSINAGRKGFATKGKEGEGRVSYEKGIAEAMSAFRDALATADSKTIVLAEYTFLLQELHFCDKSDKDAFGSLSQAIRSFDDAFLCLEAVDDTAGYKVVDKAFPRNPEYRVRGFPKDAFHIACIAHGTRLRNVLRSPGIDSMEKELLKLRLANLPAAQDSHSGKQKRALAG
ncbi:MAG: hypothetical protein FWE09_05075 [Treponema sp.]|nr:hypothetical protein [Treponema sp.]